MSTNRRTRSWPLKAQFSAEVLELFLRLEELRQSTPEFKAGSKRLAALLGLTSEWWTCNHVHDRSRGPCHPKGYDAFDDWHTCRRVRQELLAAVGARKEKSLAN